MPSSVSFPSIPSPPGLKESSCRPHAPDAVLFPKNVEQVSAIARICNENKVPIIPFGTGTGIEGGVVAIHGGVTIDLKEMDQVLQVNEEDFDCVVQPGVTR